MFNNKPDNEADFCESYKAEILNNASEERDSSLGKILTIFLLIAIIIGLSLVGYKYFITQSGKDVLTPPTSIQVSDDELKVTLDEEEAPEKREELKVEAPKKVEKIIEPVKEKSIVQEPKESVSKVEVIKADISTVVEEVEEKSVDTMQEIPMMKEVTREKEVKPTETIISNPTEIVTMHEVVSSKKEMKEVEIITSKPSPVVNQVNSSAIDQIANSIKLSIAAKEQKNFSKNEHTPLTAPTSNSIKEEKNPIEPKKINSLKEEKNLEVPLSVAPAPEAQYLEELADLSKQLDNEKN